MKTLKVKYDTKKITLTPGFIKAVKNLMREEILMMRKVHPDSKDCWVFGVAEINDMASAGFLSVMYCGKEDIEWMKKRGQIHVRVPL